ncbi:MAG: CDP-alcohol phosphatidyltransferase family protein [Dehalococcoidia bacterium]|nr:CDP-alcohol phosphatidyltransferase family protein [Dehalococcoidia bacterium]
MKSTPAANKALNPELTFELNLPNIVTTIRVVLAGFAAWLLFSGEFLAAGILIVIAALTDGLDGLLARRLKQSSLFGSIFDMVADQLLFMPCLILAIIAGLFSKADHLMPLNPYPYAVLALAGGVAVFAGIGSYLWKRRSHAMEFPTPTGIAKVNFWFWLAPLVIAVFRIGPAWLLAGLMYLAIVSTILTFYSYLKKGSYVFTD